MRQVVIFYYGEFIPRALDDVCGREELGDLIEAAAPEYFAVGLDTAEQVRAVLAAESTSFREQPALCGLRSDWEGPIPRGAFVDGRDGTGGALLIPYEPY